jgi:hypothetical protein
MDAENPHDALNAHRLADFATIGMSYSDFESPTRKQTSGIADMHGPFNTKEALQKRVHGHNLKPFQNMISVFHVNRDADQKLVWAKEYEYDPENERLVKIFG